ncbi:alanine racemase [Microbacterium sp. NPDC091313]
MTARLVVDLDRFAANLRLIRERVAPARHMLVVKNDAYGHGLEAIVRRARAEGVSWFGAFDAATGARVRAVTGPEARIFVWILASDDDIRTALAADLDLGVGDMSLLEDVARLSATTFPRVHLKIDTGLHRNGVRPDEWPDAVARAAELQNAGRLAVEGVWSHIAEASDAEDDASRMLFLDARRTLARAGLTPRFSHLAASAAGFAREEFREDLVRIGAFAYGIRPAGGASEEELGLEPIARLEADVIAVDGTRAQVGIGALDGIPTPIGGLVSAGTPAGPRRIVAVESTRTVIEGWDGMTPGDVVTLWGAAAPHSATDVAERLATIGEEIAVRISPMVARKYV